MSATARVLCVDDEQLESGAASLVAEYRSEGRLLAVAGVNAGPAVMTRRPDIVRAYQQRSLADIGLG